MVLTLDMVRKLTPEKPCLEMIHCTVMDKSSRTTYNRTKVMATVVLADSSHIIKAQVYDMDSLDLMILNGGLQIKDFIPKSNGEIIINKKTQVFISKPLAIPQEIKAKIDDIKQKKFTTLDAATSPKKTNVGSIKGVVAKASAVQLKRVRSTGEEISFKKIKLRDEEGDKQVCLWRNLASTNIQTGDIVHLSNFIVTDTFNNINQPVPAISNKFDSATVEILPEDEKLLSLLSENDDLEDEYPEKEPVKVTGFGKIYRYLSCSYPSCYRKKLVNFKCDKCGVMYNEKTAVTSVTGQFLTEDGKQYTYFNNHAEDIRKGLNIPEEISNIKFTAAIVEKLPFTAYIDSKDSKVSKIQIIPS